MSDSFHGYVEGNDIAEGTVDVIVADGFCGNIALKSIEGTAKLFIDLIKASFRNNIFSKIGYLLSKKSLKKYLSTLEPKNHNGAMLVGLNGIVVKSHGSADAESFCNAIKVAYFLVKEDVNNKITSSFDE